MTDEKKPDPVEDLKKGLGLLFRAAKTAVDDLPTGKLEEAVKSGAREVGRAIENVTQTIDKELFHKKSSPPAAPPTAQATAQATAEAPRPAAADAPAAAAAPLPKSDEKTDDTKDEPPKL